MNRIADDLESTSRKEIETRFEKFNNAYNKFKAISQQLAALISKEEYQEKKERGDKFWRVILHFESVIILQYINKLQLMFRASSLDERGSIRW